MLTNISKCRICGASDFVPVMSLGEQALTGVFPRTKDVKVTSGPLDLVKCCASNGCGLVQLKQSYQIDEMYGMNYGYRSGLNASMVRHLHEKVNKILAMNILNDGDVVIDIGSNDATTLSAYPKDKFVLVGIDPTGVKFKNFYPSEIKLVPEFFSSKAVRLALGDKKAKVITSFSMYYDLEDPVGFAREIENSLDSDGIWITEQSYLPSMLRTNSFDTICHEHLEFYSLRQIVWIANAVGLKVLDVEFNDVNGGSFSIVLSKQDSLHVPNQERVEKILADERSLGLDGIEVYSDFRGRVETAKRELVDFLIKSKREKAIVYGLGASTKGNVLLQYFGLDSDLIAAIGEVNEEKFGAYTPGTYIPLISEDEMLNANPDYIVVLPWHFRKFFENLNKLKGRTLVFPLPKFEILTI